MIHTYKVSGMTCSGCLAKVRNLLSNVAGINKVSINLSLGEASIEIDKHINTLILKDALKDFPEYQLTEINHQSEIASPSVGEEADRSWIITYKPILLIFAYITGITLLVEWTSGEFNWMRWMQYFMAGFFLIFSFFKLLNLKGFVDSYAMYDIIAKKWKSWGYVYALAELALGVGFLVGYKPLVANSVTLVVMSVSFIGVFQSVLNRKKIKCACLGDVFNLPMSTITIIEDALMIAMSAIMIITLL